MNPTASDLRPCYETSAGYADAYATRLDALASGSLRAHYREQAQWHREHAAWLRGAIASLAARGHV